MVITLDNVKKKYNFSITEVLLGDDVVKANKCSQWTRNKELQAEKDLVYVRITIATSKKSIETISYKQFYLEDSEGYFCVSKAPDDYLDDNFSEKKIITGGLLFSIYQDIDSSRLWFDTGIHYDDTEDSIFIDIALPTEKSETRTEILSKEAMLMKQYTKQIEMDLNKEKITPEEQTKMIMKKLSDKFGVPYKKIDNGYLLRVPLFDGRKQNIIITFSGKDEKGKDLITIATICAPVAVEKNNRIFLKLNPKLAFGAVGITIINSEAFYVITQTYPVILLEHKSIIIDAIEYIASQGDWVEKKLIGKDLR